MAIASLVVRLAADIAEFESNLASAERSLQKTGRNMEQIGTQLTKGLTVPIVAIGGLALKAAIDFEDSFAGVRKTVDATDEQFKELEGTFRDLAKTMPASVVEINRVAEAAGQVGVHRDDIAAFTETMIKLGTATNLTAQEAATGMQQFANALGQPRIDMEKLGSALVDLGNNGAATEKQILELAGRMAGTGAQIGLTAGEIFGMSNALAGVAIDAEKGGTAISRLFRDIESAAQLGGEQLKEFAKVAGLTGEQFTKLFKEDPAAVITAFVEGLGRMKAAGESLNPVMEKLGITEIRYADTVKLAANASDQFAESVRRGTKAFQEGEALDKEYQERLKTTASQLKILKSNLMDVAITLGQAMLPAVNQIVSGSKPVIEVFAGIASSFKELPGPIQNVTLAFIGLLAAAGPVVFIASQVVKAWASLLAIIRFVPAALNAISTAFILMAGSMGATTTGLRGVSGAFVLLRGAAAALVSSLGAIPLALTAIALALPKAIDGIRNLANAIREKRFWEFITTKDAPAIWEREFWGMSKGASAAAASISDLGDAGGVIVEDFIPGVVAAKKEITGKGGLQQAAFDLATAFSNLDPATQRSAEVIERTGKEALKLKDAGAQLTPELEKLANKAMADITRQTKAAAKEMSEYAELMEKIKGASIPLSESDRKRALELHQLGLSYKGIAEALKGNELAIKSYIESQERFGDAKMAAEVKQLEDAFRGLSAEQLKSPDIQRRVGEAAENLRLEGAKLTPELLALAAAFQKLNEPSNFGTHGFDQFENVTEWIDNFKKFNDELERSEKALIGFGEQGFNQFENTKDWSAQWDEFNETFEKSLKFRLKETVPDIITTLANALLSGPSEHKWKQVGASIGATIGGAIGAYFGGPAGAALGQAVGGALGGALGGLFDATDYEKRVRSAAEAFRQILEREFGSSKWYTGRGMFEFLNDPEAQQALDRLKTQFAALGIDIDAALRTRDPEWLQEVLDEGRARMEALGVAMDAINVKATLFAAPFQALIDKQKEGKITQDEFTASLAALGEKGQAEFERIGIFAAATFNTMVRATGDAIGALDRLSPALSVLQQGLKDFGLTSTGTIDALLGLFKLVHDETTGPILQAIQATGQIFAGLQDAGLLTADLFQTVSDDIGAAFRDLEAKGGDVAKAMALSQPVLQRLWEAQQLYGEVTDETTRKILQQAEDQGLVGDHMKDVNQRILDVLIAIADVFGAKIPDSMRTTRQAATETARTIEDELGRIKIPTIYVPVDFEYPDGAPHHDRVPFLAEGGIVRKRTLAVIGESGPEAVIPLSRLASVAPEAGSTTVILQMDGRDVAEVVVPHIPGIARRYVTV